MPDQSFRVKYFLNSGGKMETIHTDWEVYAKKHVHGARPPGTAVANAVVQLQGYVQARCTALGVPYPGNAAISTGYELETKSSH